MCLLGRQVRSRLEGAVRRRAITVGSSDSRRSIGSPVQEQRSTTARSFEIETIRQLPARERPVFDVLEQVMAVGVGGHRWLRSIRSPVESCEQPRELFDSESSNSSRRRTASTIRARSTGVDVACGEAVELRCHGLPAHRPGVEALVVVLLALEHAPVAQAERARGRCAARGSVAKGGGRGAPRRGATAAARRRRRSARGRYCSGSTWPSSSATASR